MVSEASATNNTAMDDYSTSTSEIVDASAVAAALEQAVAAAAGNTAYQTQHLSNSTKAVPPLPEPLPPGWIMKESRSQPNYYYYYHHETGISTWLPPAPMPETTTNAATTTLMGQESLLMGAAAAGSAVHGSLALNVIANNSNNSTNHISTVAEQAEDANPTSFERSESSKSQPSTNSLVTSKKRPTPTIEEATSTNNNKRSRPSKVRIFHILKKHKDSRRPSSWRVAKIDISKEAAHEELQALLEVLQEVQQDPAELRATFEELARTESDCSSAKRNGDLGFFGPGKMQPPFEKASFALEIGQLSDIVESNSGLHVLLRVG